MPVAVALDNIRSAYNTGSIFRSCDAFHVSMVICGGITPTPLNSKLAKTALGSECSVVWEKASNLYDYLCNLKSNKKDMLIIGVEHTSSSIPLSSLVPSPSLFYILIFGNELYGISSEILNICDMAVEIEQFGTKHSLNVSVCCGIVLWHFFIHLSRKVGLLTTSIP